MQLVTTTGRRAFGVVASAAVAVLISTSPAWAHDKLVKANPSAGAKVSEQISELHLDYSANLLTTGSQVSVSADAGGKAEATTTVVGRRVTAALPQPLTPGGYKVSWRVVSSDGHPISGSYNFTVTAAATANPSSALPATAAGPNSTTPSSATSDVAAQAAATTKPASAPAANDGQVGWVAWLAGGSVLIVACVAAIVGLSRRNVDHDKEPANV